MPKWSLRRVQASGDREVGRGGEDGVIGIRGLAGGARGLQRAVRCELPQAEPALAAREHSDGDTAVVRRRLAEGGPSDAVGLQEWVQAFLPAPRHPRLLPLSIRREVLPMYCPTVWLGALGTLVYEATEASRTVSQIEDALPRSAIHRRVSGGPGAARRQGYENGQCEGGEEADCTFWSAGSGEAPYKGCWEGSQPLDHRGMHLDTVAMRVLVSDKKVTRVRALTKKLLLLAQRNRRLVPLALLRHFCGVCVSLTLALPLDRFYTRSLYFAMSLAERRCTEREEREKSHQIAPRSELAGSRRNTGGFVRVDEARAARTPRASKALPKRFKVRLCRQSLRPSLLACIDQGRGTRLSAVRSGSHHAQRCR